MVPSLLKLVSVRFKIFLGFFWHILEVYVNILLFYIDLDSQGLHWFRFSGFTLLRFSRSSQWCSCGGRVTVFSSVADNWRLLGLLFQEGHRMYVWACSPLRDFCFSRSIFIKKDLDFYSIFHLLYFWDSPHFDNEVLPPNSGPWYTQAEVPWQTRGGCPQIFLGGSHTFRPFA